MLLFLFATRDTWVKGARISRKVAFQTVAFSGVGFYPIAMSLLAQCFMTRSSRENGRDFRGHTPDAIAAIADWHWPGNVRELENRMKRAVIMAEAARLTAADFDLVNTVDEATLTIKFAREAADRNAIRRAMVRADGNVSLAAKLLGVSRPTLCYLLEQYGMENAA